ncbi:alpha-glucosidase family protein [Allorhizobium sp. BGMRC 0089]|uniref:beta-galactosidase BglA n=1 Tax=Allorhizobium sonneratiae TaxID=2934936 RepID=UPI0020349357|nr:alpha-glucosidase family protein [Allorhizobium sonneratiae]MCM2291367.1 alpha-glucosidase family protein [Allorhizobium sonneratiae]
MNAATVTATTPDKDWWRGAVIYQIYPRSYQDSNGDGIGDLRGITARLPHVAALGADAIWISPFFTSPMKDFGYDVANYIDVDPMFGSLGDFDMLMAEAHRLGIKVMIDLVISHTSDQHPWFVESRSSRINARSDWYVWSDPKPDGTPPNNWLSIFGGSAWAWDPTRMQYYLHNFLTSQPDLNLHNPQVQEAVLDVVRFWLKRGVDGFRLDTINFYFHDRHLRDNPPLAPERRNAATAPAVNPYNFQEHIYDKNQPENLEFLKRFRAVLEEFPAIAAVGEVGDSQFGLEIVGQYTSGGDKMQMCYAFEFLSPDPLTPSLVANTQQAFERAAPEGWACWAFSNHDVVRHVSRWGAEVVDRDAFAKLTAAILLTQRGSVCLYQGEELGLTEAVLSYEDLQDPYGKEFWPEFKGRDGCRTPMVWDSHSHQSGFSSAEKPWLPIPVEHHLRSVSEQQGHDGSVLEQYRRFLTFRKQHEALIKGEIVFHTVSEALLVYERRLGNQAVLCAFNLSAQSQDLVLPQGVWQALDGHGFVAETAGDRVNLPAWGAYFASNDL